MLKNAKENRDGYQQKQNRWATQNMRVDNKSNHMNKYTNVNESHVLVKR